MDSANNNIDKFNECVALIFSELYKSFPVRIPIVYNDHAIKLFKDEDDVTEYEVTLNVFESTVAWLKDSDYIWAETEGDTYAYGVVLSPKGLEVLKLIPDSLKENKSIGDKLLEIAKGGTKEARATLIQIALTEGSKLLRS